VVRAQLIMDHAKSHVGGRGDSHSVAVDGGEQLAARSDRLILRVHLILKNLN